MKIVRRRRRAYIFYCRRRLVARVHDIVAGHFVVDTKLPV